MPAVLWPAPPRRPQQSDPHYAHAGAVFAYTAVDKDCLMKWDWIVISAFVLAGLTVLLLILMLGLVLVR